MKETKRERLNLTDAASGTMVRSEKRREQSRTAAKCRRQVESRIFSSLAGALPTLDDSTVYQIDRIGLLRLFLSFYKIRSMGRLLAPAKTCAQREDAFVFDEKTVADCLEGFLLIINGAGQFVYASNGVASSVGFTQTDLIGKFLMDYIHPDDWPELCDELRQSKSSDEMSNDPAQKNWWNTFFRMKTALTPRGVRARKITTGIYQSMKAHIVKVVNKSDSFEKGTTAVETVRLVHCVPVFLISSYRSNPSSVSVTSRHGFDMRFRFCDERLAATLFYASPKSLIGRSFFEFVYPDDLQRVLKQLRRMYESGQCNLGYYRLCTGWGGFVWAETEASVLIQNIRGMQQKSIVCGHHILSNFRDPEYLPQPTTSECATPAPKEKICSRIPPIVDECKPKKRQKKSLHVSVAADPAPSVAVPPPCASFTPKSSNNPMLADDSSPPLGTLNNAADSDVVMTENECGTLSNNLAPYIAADTFDLAGMSDTDMLPLGLDEFLSAENVLIPFYSDDVPPMVPASFIAVDKSVPNSCRLQKTESNMDMSMKEQMPYVTPPRTRANSMPSKRAAVAADPDCRCCSTPSLKGSQELLYLDGCQIGDRRQRLDEKSLREFEISMIEKSLADDAEMFTMSRIA